LPGEFEPVRRWHPIIEQGYGKLLVAKMFRGFHTKRKAHDPHASRTQDVGDKLAHLSVVVYIFL
jgi:hypothetical protein